MINTSVATPTSYHLQATLSAWDNDGLGLLLGYGDEDNYISVAFRKQSDSGSGYAQGVSVNKVVGGVVNDGALIPSTSVSTAFIPQSNNTPFDVDIAVNGSEYSISVREGANPFTTVLTGTDTSGLLAANHKYGVFSWCQKNDGTTALLRGTEVRSVTVTNGDASEVLKSHTFNNASPETWNKLVMKNAAGAVDTAAAGKGNFRLDFRDGTIVDDSNGYKFATSTAPHVDFLGPSVILAKAVSSSWEDYTMQARLKSGDDDGIGLLLRASTDVDGNATAFYRVNFTNQAIGSGDTRAPQGMSIQKFSDGAWTEIFRDNQTTPLFVYALNTPFDVKATIVDGTINVNVMQNGVEYNYGPVIDANPILAGSVGFTNWGNGDAYNGTVSGSIFGPYGGVVGTPLLVAVPEPSTLILLGMAASLMLVWRRRR
jgi:hypothetical protein